MGEFYSISIKEKKIKLIEYKIVEREYTRLYRLFQESKKHKIYRIFLDANIVLISDVEGKIKVFNNNTQTKYFLNNIIGEFYDIDFSEGTFAIFNENRIEIITNNNKMMVYPDDNYMFLKGKLLRKYNDTYLVILSSNKSDVDWQHFSGQFFRGVPA